MQRALFPSGGLTTKTIQNTQKLPVRYANCGIVQQHGAACIWPYRLKAAFRRTAAGVNRGKWVPVQEHDTSGPLEERPAGLPGEPALGSMEEQHRLLMECVTDYAIFFLDRQGRIANWNAGAERIFGYADAEIVGRHFACLSLPEDIQNGRPERELHTAATTGRASDSCWLVRKDGRRLWCAGVTTALRDEEARLRGFAKVLRDQTEHLHLEETLRQRAEELAEETHRKDEFLKVLAHELRNPLAPIRNALQIICMAAQDASLVEQMRAIADRQLGHLIHLVDDLLDLSRISRGVMCLHKELVDLAQPVRNAVEGVQPLIQERNLILSVLLPAKPLYLEADPTRLQQIVHNLLSNAAKYTDPGGWIQLTAQQETGKVVLHVQDTGIGIAAETLPHIFELFVQGERRLNRSQGGLGIGLTLVRQLVEMHGGTISASSEGLGKGSEFIVRLPASPDDPQQLQRQLTDEPQPAAPAPSRRILVVDDNVDAAESLATLLRLKGHIARVAKDGPTALAIARAERPEVVILDLGMPGTDGFEVARQLRAMAETKNTVLVAITGWSREEDRQRCYEAGFDGHLPKPVDLSAVQQFLDHPKLLRRSGFSS